MGRNGSAFRFKIIAPVIYKDLDAALIGGFKYLGRKHPVIQNGFSADTLPERRGPDNGVVDLRFQSAQLTAYRYSK